MPGPVSADQLGSIVAHDALLSICSDAKYAYNITIDCAALFATLAHKLRQFRSTSGGTIVDAIGMFYGRDLHLYEPLSRATASTS